MVQKRWVIIFGTDRKEMYNVKTTKQGKNNIIIFRMKIGMFIATTRMVASI